MTSPLRQAYPLDKKYFTGFKLQLNILPVELEQLNQEQFSAFRQEH
jgi:hypothetical protein